MKSLNIGCGADTWGDVRLDVAFNFLMDTFKPTILADAHYLPFKDRSFNIVKASHVLEHLKDPLKALDEMMRVAEAKIVLKFPIEWDVLPVFISNILPIPNISSIKHAYMTRKKGLHMWVLNPEIIMERLKRKGWKTKCIKGDKCLFGSLESGRKAKHFQWLTKIFRIPYEYVVIAWKNKGAATG